MPISGKDRLMRDKAIAQSQITRAGFDSGEDLSNVNLNTDDPRLTSSALGATSLKAETDPSSVAGKAASRIRAGIARAKWNKAHGIKE